MKQFCNKKKLPSLLIFNQDGVATVEVPKGKLTVKSKQLTNTGACFELWAVEVVKNGENYPVAIFSDKLSAQNEINRLFEIIDDFKPNQAFQFAKDDTITTSLELYDEFKVAGYF